MEINRVLLLGNLTQDPETRYLPSGMAVCKLRLASNRRFRDKSGETREETLFINVDVWGRQAENCQEYLRKGSEVFVEGRLKMESYQTQEGQNRSYIAITADRVQFGRRPGQGQGGFPSNAPEEEPMEPGGNMTPPPPQQARPQRPAVGGDYRTAARPAASPAQAKPAAPAPTWQREETADAPPEEPPSDDTPGESGGTNNDLPF